MICDVCFLEVPEGREEDHALYHAGVFVLIENNRKALDDLEVVYAKPDELA